VPPIRILHVVDSLGRGGLENGLVNLIRGLDPGRFEHVVCAVKQLGDNAERLPADRVQIICLGQTQSGSRLTRLISTIAKYQPDIVHSRNWPAIEGVLAGRWRRVRGVIHSEHGLDDQSSVGEPWRRLCFRRVAYQLAHRVVSVSSQLAQLHARRTGFPAQRISVIHNGVNGVGFRPDPAIREATRRELGFAEGELCIGCVGNLLPVKDHLTVLRAFGEIAGRTEGRKWRLVIAGEGPERPRLESFLNQNRVWKGRVELLGLSSRIPQLLNALDIYVLSSLTEGISNSLLEAMATGLPVIATDTGGNPEVVNGDSGLLFDPGDFHRLAEHLLALESQPDFRLELGRKSRQRVLGSFSIEAMVQQYGQLYEGFSAPVASLERPAVRV
jgi:sugar transferase (PEP-CTERM/EpsH1 system associated)